MNRFRIATIFALALQAPNAPHDFPDTRVAVAARETSLLEPTDSTTDAPVASGLDNCIEFEFENGMVDVSWTRRDGLRFHHAF